MGVLFHPRVGGGSIDNDNDVQEDATTYTPLKPHTPLCRQTSKELIPLHLPTYNAIKLLVRFKGV